MLNPSTGLPSEYEILRVLGSGANGLVYLARNSSGDLCALKEFAVTPAVAQRFFREASMVFTLVHDNVVRCQNLLYGKGGRSFLVFDYIEGGTLRDSLFETDTLSAPEALEMMRQLCLGLSHAHESGIIHCDLKPENILIQRRADGVSYKIADLGIARYTAEVDGAQGAPGSPAYMAPEQFYGRCDARSDLYSLGVLLFEATAGSRPFDGPPAALFLMHSQHEPELSLIPDAACADLAGRLLAKQPGSRPQSAAAVLAEAECLLAAAPPRPETGELLVIEPQDAMQALPALAPLSTERVILNMEMPGARSLVTLFTPSSARLLVNDQSACDLVDLLSTRTRPHFLPELAAPSAGDGSLFATSRFIRSFDSACGASRTLFAHQTRVAAFAHDAERQRVFYANMRALFCATYTGEVFWRADCRNYVRPPQMLASSSGVLLVTSGPVLPGIHAYHDSGNHAYSISTSGPVLTLRDEGAPGRFSAILQGLGADAPARYVIFHGDALESQVELGSGIFHAAWHGNLLSVHHTDGRIQLLDQHLNPVWQYRGAGVALGDCWHPHLRIWGVLERESASVWLRAFALTPLTAESPVSTASHKQ